MSESEPDTGAPDRCPRCGGAFSCGAALPGPCACTTLTLSPALQARLRGAYSGCLCLACLREAAAAEAPAPSAG
ncbi:conserved hypothetical protein [Rubrivivax sp. A210]|uniref:cysteine-rich CWC family protein n=1 Tax=Rubrivivax sp. A210 TaxID=2772301 RepID=UPI00191A549B|nr:cysteine-rich CWC family protein [Rubrivivax sp. A210]CAD5374125.1 conserved hypothetical protein [Rubrivivax sp. A210]